MVLRTKSLAFAFSAKPVANSCSLRPFSTKPAWHCSKCKRASCSFKRLCSKLSRIGCSCCSFCMRTRSNSCNTCSALAKWLRASASAVSRSCLLSMAKAKLIFSVSIGVSFSVCSASVWRFKNAVFSSLLTLILLFNSLILLTNIFLLKKVSW